MKIFIATKPNRETIYIKRLFGGCTCISGGSPLEAFDEYITEQNTSKYILIKLF